MFAQVENDATENDNQDNYAEADSLQSDSLQCDSIPPLPWPESLQANLDSIIQKSVIFRSSQLGLMVYDLTADSVLYEHNAKQTMRPASTMKLLTAITALDKLGDAYLFKTRLTYTGTIKDSTLIGDIYCIGGMDPKLGNDDLKSFAISIREAGIDTIRGNFYADRSMKDDKMFGEGWCWDDKNPVLSPLAYTRKDILMDKLREALLDAGVVIDDSAALAGAEFPIAKTSPAGAITLCERTHTMEQILHTMMKDSNNMYAECLLYQIGLTQGKPSTAKKARAVEEALLRKIGMGSVPHRFADGSGLSLYNYVSAEMEVAFLKYAYNNSNIFTHLYTSLPIAGIDGTLEKRMNKSAAEGNVHAKTGTLSGISSLAGYCTASNDHKLCFAIINQGIMHNSGAKNFQDKVCIAMCK